MQSGDLDSKHLKANLCNYSAWILSPAATGYGKYSRTPIKRPPSGKGQVAA